MKINVKPHMPTVVSYDVTMNVSKRELELLHLIMSYPITVSDAIVKVIKGELQFSNVYKNTTMDELEETICNFDHGIKNFVGKLYTTEGLL